jgi:hypothetical protein
LLAKIVEGEQPPLSLSLEDYPLQWLYFIINESKNKKSIFYLAFFDFFTESVK